MVAGEQNQRVRTKAFALDGLDHLAGGPINLRDRIANMPELRFAHKAFRGSCRIVRIGEGEIKKKWIVVLRFDQLHGFGGVPLRQFLTIGVGLKNCGIPKERQRFHVDAVRNAIKRVEPSIRGQILQRIAKVPFADGHRLVTLGTEEIRK